AQAFTALGLRVVLLGAVVVLAAALAFVAAARLLGLSTARTAGAVAGFIGQPASLVYATNGLPDDRVEAGYASMFALGIIAKILLVQLVVTTCPARPSPPPRRRERTSH